MTSVVQARPERGWHGAVGGCMRPDAIWPASCARAPGALAMRMEVAPCWMRGARRGRTSCRADDEDGLAAQAAEYLAREIDGDRCDGDGGAADAVSVRTRLATEKARWRSGSSAEEMPGLTRDGVGLLDLPRILRLADDHGVERAGDAEEMADGLALAES